MNIKNLPWCPWYLKHISWTPCTAMANGMLLILGESTILIFSSTKSKFSGSVICDIFGRNEIIAWDMLELCVWYTTKYVRRLLIQTATHPRRFVLQIKMHSRSFLIPLQRENVNVPHSLRCKPLFWIRLDHPHQNLDRCISPFHHKPLFSMCSLFQQSSIGC